MPRPLSRSLASVALVALVALPACGAATAPLVEDPPDAAPTADLGGADGGVRVDAGPAPEGLVFRLTFRSDVGAGESIYAQQSSSSREGPAWLWIATVDGAAIDITGSCTLCPCAGTTCLDCPRCGPPPDSVAALSGAGGLIEHRWDGLAHTTDTCAAAELALCAAPPVPAPTGDYFATFCWSTTASGVGLGQTIGMSTCDAVTFHLPDADGIVEDTVVFGG